MKLLPLTVLTAFLIAANTAHTQVPNPTITLFENGTGNIQLPNGAIIPQFGSRASDPGPGGQSSALTFVLHPREDFFTVGDVLLVDLLGNVSDVIRFNPGVFNGMRRDQSIVFYSNDLSGGLLGDTGLPSASYANFLRLLENEGGFTIYTPIAGQPGFVPMASAPITFRFFSAVPDTGSSLSLLAIAVGGIALLHRRMVSRA